MQFLGISSSLFATLAAALGGAIVLMYLFKLRRRRVQVPYSLLWERVLGDRQARSLWHRVKRLLSLLLQLAILLLVLLALRDPRPADYEPQGRHVLLVVDTSASMATIDMPAGADRMEAARRAALEVFDGLGPDDSLMVVRAEGQIRPLTPFVRPSVGVREQIAALDTTATRAELAQVMEFASRALFGKPRPELVLITDGAFGPEDLEAAADVSLPSIATTRVICVGSATGNVAITAFNVRRYPSDRRNYEVFLEVTNTFDEPVTLELTLSANDRPIDRRLVEVPADDVAVRFFPNLARGGSRISARIEVVGGDAVDVFPLDDVAFALLPREERLRVLVVTPENLYVEAPLLLNQNYRVTVMRPDEYRALGDDPTADYDVTVFSDFAPPLPERGNFLLLNPAGESSPWPIRGTVEDPIIDRFDRDDPLMRWIHGFRSVNIASALRLRLSEGDRAVARSIAGDPMFVRTTRDGLRLVGVAFAVERSDFALRLSYPLFIINAIDWLTQDEAPLLESYRTGRAWRVYVGPREESTAWVVPPEGPARLADVVDGYVTVFPEQPGFFEVAFGRETDDAEEIAEAVRAGREAADETVAANLADPRESDVAPAESLPVRDTAGERAVEGAGLAGFREPWLLLVLAAVALLVLEWVTFNRRMTV